MDTSAYVMNDAPLLLGRNTKCTFLAGTDKHTNRADIAEHRTTTSAWHEKLLLSARTLSQQLIINQEGPPTDYILVSSRKLGCRSRTRM